MRNCILMLVLLLPVFCFAQSDDEDTAIITESTHDTDTISFESDMQQLVSSYQDSIRILRHRLDSIQQARVSRYTFGSPAAPDGTYASLFLPLNFDKSLAFRRFSSNSLDEGLSLMRHDIDDALFHQYVYFPDNINRAKEKRKEAEKKPDNEQVYVPKKEVEFSQMSNADEVKLRSTDLVITRPNFWKFSGEYNLRFMQNHFSKNWFQGGESNYNVEGSSVLRLNYNNKQKVKLDNTLEMRLGFRTNKGDTVHSVKPSTDQLRYTGRLGFKATKRWDYTVQFIASSQFMRNFATNSNRVQSDFLSPLTLNLSVGMAYNFSWFKGKLTGTANFAPLSANYKYVDREALRRGQGIEEGKSGKLDYGSSITINYNWNISKNVSWSSRFYFYTPYDRVESYWENTFNLRISKYITTTIYLYPRYDDSNPARRDRDLGYFQLKEYTALGITYTM